jgi:hypothetical protein
MNDRTLQHHRAGADIIYPAVIVEGEHARRDHHELETAGREVKMEIGWPGIGPIDRQVCRNLVQQEGFIVLMKALVRSVIKCLRPISRLV